VKAWGAAKAEQTPAENTALVAPVAEVKKKVGLFAVKSKNQTLQTAALLI
jgi:hypothetical protein